MFDIKSNILPAVANIFLPELGQLFQERYLAALVFFAGTLFLFFTFVPFAAVAYLIAIFDALFWNLLPAFFQKYFIENGR